jgi:hypothetical protein
MKYYPAINKNEMISFSGIWIELKIIILSKKSKIQKEKYHMFTYMHNLEQMKKKEERGR